MFCSSGKMTACRMSVVVFLSAFCTMQASAVSSDTAERAGPLVRSLCGTSRDVSCEQRATCRPGFSVTQCRCDDECHRYGDCCYDQREQECAARGQDHTTAPPSDSGYRCLEQPMGYGVASDINSGHWRRATCAPSWAGSQDVKTLCEATSLEDIPSNVTPSSGEFSTQFLYRLPVYGVSTREHYKNVYCARCNHLTSADTRYYSIEVECVEPRDQPIQTGLFDKLKDLIEVDGCKVEFRIPGGEEVASTRNCLRLSHISSCHENFTDPEVISLCHSYSAFITAGFGDMYRNPHCAICNFIPISPSNEDQEQLLRLVNCRIFIFEAALIPGNPPTLSFLILFDTSLAKNDAGGSTTGNGGVDCPTGTVWDAVSRACILKANSYTYKLTLTGVWQKRDMEPTEVSDTILGMIRANFSSELNQRLSDSAVAGNARISVEIVNVTSSFKVGWSDNSGLNVPILMLEPIYILSVEVRYAVTELATTTEIIQIINNTAISLTSPSNQNSTYVMDMDTFLLIGYDTGAQEQSVTKVICDNLILIKHDKDIRNYTIDIDDNSITILLQKSNLTLNISEYFIYGNELFICDHVYKRYFPKTQKPGSLKLPTWLGITTFLLTVISLLCLVIGMLIEVILKEFRTLAGANLCTLMCVMFLSQLTILIQQQAVSTDAASCYVSAAFVHFTFLVFFAWMNMCAFSIYRSFTKLFETRHTNVKKSYAKYSTFAYLVPLIFVGTTSIVHFAVTPMYGTRSGGLCWFVDITALLAAFGLPILLVILSNVFFFIRTVYALRDRPASVTLDKKQTMQQNITIIARITVLMGFTWIFPFLALIPHEDNRSYYLAIQILSDILAALQGTMIFMAFVLRTRVYYALKDKISQYAFMQSSLSTSRTSVTNVPNSEVRNSTTKL